MLFRSRWTFVGKVMSLLLNMLSRLVITFLPRSKHLLIATPLFSPACWEPGKKAFLSDQCKEIEGNSRMGKTSDLFKKIRDTNGTFHAKMGTIKDSMDLTEAEDIKKRWQEYTEELYK